MGRTGVARAPAEGRSFTCAMGVTFSYHASKLSSTSIPIDFWITTRSFLGHIYIFLGTCVPLNVPFQIMQIPVDQLCSEILLRCGGPHLLL